MESLRLWCGLALPLVLVFVACGGCGLSGSASSEKPERNLDMVDDSDSTGCYDQNKNGLTLEHDFGVLKPEVQVEHCFAIKNNTAGRWTVRKIINTCACTATDLSAPAIEAREQESVTVTYRAGRESSDDTRKVVVLFEEREAPPLFLVIRAKIREAMTVTPSRVAYRQLGKGLLGVAGVEVQNFGDVDWQGILVEPSEAWLSARAVAIKNLAKDARPRQSWRVTVRADSTGLSPGEHRGVIVVKPVGTAGVTRDIPVCATITSAMTAIPGQLFFGKVTVGDAVTQRITVGFAPEAIPSSPNDVLLEHNIGDQLRVYWSKSEGEFWELVAELTPKHVGEMPGAKLTVRFADVTMPRVEVPIYAVVDPR